MRAVDPPAEGFVHHLAAIPFLAALVLGDVVAGAQEPVSGTVADSLSGLPLAGAEVRLKFKPRQQARAEHELDRFTQARDSYAMLLEERYARVRGTNEGSRGGA